MIKDLKWRCITIYKIDYLSVVPVMWEINGWLDEAYSPINMLYFLSLIYRNHPTSAKENTLFGEQVVLARRLRCQLASGTVQLYLYIILSSRQPYLQCICLSFYILPIFYHHIRAQRDKSTYSPYFLSSLASAVHIELLRMPHFCSCTGYVL